MGSRFEHRFAITIGYTEASATVTIDGDLDRASVTEFESATRTLIGSVPLVVIDVRAATLIDSAALGALIKLHRHADDVSGRLEILTGPPYQQVLFDTAGLSNYLDVRQTD